MNPESLPPLPKDLQVFVDKPYGGLFGNSVLAHVIEEMVASPSVIYRPKDLEELTGKSEPSIRSALATLLSLNMIENISPEASHPRYRVNILSKKFVALSFLAYAILDDRDGSDCMNTAVHHYYSTQLREKYEPVVYSQDVKKLTEEIARYVSRMEPISNNYLQVTA